jgi:hypothetical protein
MRGDHWAARSFPVRGCPVAARLVAALRVQALLVSAGRVPGHRGTARSAEEAREAAHPCGYQHAKGHTGDGAEGQ